MLELPSELAEWIADAAGAFGAGPDGDHPDMCACRICFVTSVERRIWESVANARTLRDEPPDPRCKELASGGINRSPRRCKLPVSHHAEHNYLDGPFPFFNSPVPEAPL